MLKRFLIAAWLCVLAAAPGWAQDPPAALAGSMAAAPAAWWHDWRLLSVIAAFLGFTFGTWIKHAFDLRLDRIRRDKENTVFAIAFRAELVNLISDALNRVVFVKSLQAETDPVYPAHTAALNIPPKRVFGSNTRRLGDFGRRAALNVIKAQGQADHIRNNVAAMRAGTPDVQVSAFALEVFLGDLRRLFQMAAEGVNALDAFLGDPETYPDPKGELEERERDPSRNAESQVSAK